MEEPDSPIACSSCGSGWGPTYAADPTAALTSSKDELLRLRSMLDAEQQRAASLQRDNAALRSRLAGSPQRQHGAAGRPGAASGGAARSQDHLLQRLHDHVKAALSGASTSRGGGACSTAGTGDTAHCGDQQAAAAAAAGAAAVAASGQPPAAAEEGDDREAVSSGSPQQHHQQQQETAHPEEEGEEDAAALRGRVEALRRRNLDLARSQRVLKQLVARRRPGAAAAATASLQGGGSCDEAACGGAGGLRGSRSGGAGAMMVGGAPDATSPLRGSTGTLRQDRTPPPPIPGGPRARLRLIHGGSSGGSWRGSAFSAAGADAPESLEGRSSGAVGNALAAASDPAAARQRSRGGSISAEESDGSCSNAGDGSGRGPPGWSAGRLVEENTVLTEQLQVRACLDCCHSTGGTCRGSIVIHPSQLQAEYTASAPNNASQTAQPPNHRPARPSSPRTRRCIRGCSSGTPPCAAPTSCWRS
jgi:hypothetical protein